MGQCTDNKIGEMLFAFELNLLSEEEERVVWSHLLDCDHCRRRAKRFADTANTLRHRDEARQVFSRVDSERSPIGALWTRLRGRPAAKRAIAIIAVMVIVLILRPWQIQFNPSQEAVAEGNRIAVMNFRSLVTSTDKVQWGQIISSLLTSDLSESRNVQVVSTQHLLDLRRNEQDPSTAPSEQRALELAAKAGARWIVEGDVIQLEPNPIVVARVVDARDGTVKSSEKVVAAPHQSLYALVDPLSVHIITSVVQPSLALPDPDRPVTDVTSSSPQALQWYLEGLTYRAKLYTDETIQRFEKAISYDSTFAMAYYYLSRYKAEPERGKLLAQAQKYAGKAGRRGKLLIASDLALSQGDNKRAEELLTQITREYPQENEAFYDLANYCFRQRRFEDALRNANEALKIDSGYKLAYDLLAYVYLETGDFARAMLAIEKYVALAPDDANAYDSRGDIQMRIGMRSQAIESYRRALAIKPDFAASLRKLGDCYLYSRQYELAESCYTALATARTQDPWARAGVWLMAVPALRQGDFHTAIEVLEKNLQRSDRLSSSRYDLFYLEALLLAEVGDKVKAKIAADSALAVDLALIAAQGRQAELPYAYVERIYLLAKIGDLAAAEKELSVLERLVPPETSILHLPLASGYIQLARGNYGEAARLLGSVLNLTSDYAGVYYFPVRVEYGRCVSAAGDPTTALSLFDSIAFVPANKRVFWGLLEIRISYYRGIAYERLGKTREAMTQYQEFLMMWDMAPQPISDVEDARARLARLRKSKTP